MESQYQENPSISPVMAPFDEIRKDPAFMSKLRAARSYDDAPSPGALRNASPLEVLYHMVAVETPDAVWCGRVSPNATLPDWSGRTALVRPLCYASIADNTLDATLCDRLPKAGSFPPAIAPDDWSERCRTNIAIYQRQGATPGNTRAGPLPFAHAADFAEALHAIGYENEAVTRAATPQPDQYWAFVSRLRFQGTPEARAEFVRRVLALR